MEYRSLTLADLKPWADLLAIAFDRSSYQMEQLLLWFHEGFNLIAWGAWDGAHLVAQYNCRLLELKLPGETELQKAGMGLNMAVHPAYRGQGLLDKVSRPVHERIAEQGCIAGVGFSNTLGAKVSRKSSHYDYKVLGKMTSSVIWLSQPHNSAPIELTDQCPSLPFPLSLPEDEYIRYAVTLKSIRHRFNDHPFRQYHFGVWSENALTQGIVIYRLFRFGPLLGAALLAAYSNDLATLLIRWASTIRQTGVCFVHVLTSPQSPLLKLYSLMGTRVSLPYSRSPYYLIARQLHNETPHMLFDLARWDCVGGDIL